MSDISQRLKALEQVAKANEPDESYKDVYPLMPLEFTNLIYKQGEPEQALAEIWHEVIDDYEQEHQDELHAYLKKNILPPWRRLVDLSTRQKNLKTDEQVLTKRALELYERRKSEGKI